MKYIYTLIILSCIITITAQVDYQLTYPIKKEGVKKSDNNKAFKIIRLTDSSFKTFNISPNKDNLAFSLKTFNADFSLIDKKEYSIKITKSHIIDVFKLNKDILIFYSKYIKGVSQLFYSKIDDKGEIHESIMVDENYVEKREYLSNSYDLYKIKFDAINKSILISQILKGKKNKRRGLNKQSVRYKLYDSKMNLISSNETELQIDYYPSNKTVEFYVDNVNNVFLLYYNDNFEKDSYQLNWHWYNFSEENDSKITNGNYITEIKIKKNSEGQLLAYCLFFNEKKKFFIPDGIYLYNVSNKKENEILFTEEEKLNMSFDKVAKKTLPRYKHTKIFDIVDIINTINNKTIISIHNRINLTGSSSLIPYGSTGGGKIITNPVFFHCFNISIIELENKDIKKIASIPLNDFSTESKQFYLHYDSSTNKTFVLINPSYYGSTNTKSSVFIINGEGQIVKNQLHNNKTWKNISLFSTNYQLNKNTGLFSFKGDDYELNYIKIDFK